MFKSVWNKAAYAVLIVMIALSVFPPQSVSASYYYVFLPSSAYSQTDLRAALKTYGFSGPPYPVKVEWVDPDGNKVSYCAVGSCGVAYDQHVFDNGALDWRTFYFYIDMQNRPSGKYTAIVYGYQNYSYVEQFRADFTISGNQPPVVVTKCFVDAAATGKNDGSTWTDALTNLQSALGSAPCTEVWVKSGVYKPTTTTTNRNATFQLKNGVAIYGGFAGTETARDQRDPAAHVTILSGDIDNDDSQTPIITNIKTVTGNSTNSYHVVTGANGATLDGFTITAGKANAGTWQDIGGGAGIYNKDSSPALANLALVGNAAKNGAGMTNLSSHPTITNVTFSGNYASYGGGMTNYMSDSIITNAAFINNTAFYDTGVGSFGGAGGGLYNVQSNPVVTNATFTGNTSELGFGGGIYNYKSAAVLTNITLINNSAAMGGGVFNTTDDVGGPVITNSIFWGNTDWDADPQIINDASTPTVSYSVVQFGYASGTHIITGDPKLGTIGDNGGPTQTVALLENSSALNTGSDTVCPATDQRGISRPQGTHCDVGAYEVEVAPPKYYLPAITK